MLSLVFVIVVVVVVVAFAVYEKRCATKVTQKEQVKNCAYVRCAHGPRML